MRKHDLTINAGVLIEHIRCTDAGVLALHGKLAVADAIAGIAGVDSLLHGTILGVSVADGATELIAQFGDEVRITIYGERITLRLAVGIVSQRASAACIHHLLSILRESKGNNLCEIFKTATHVHHRKESYTTRIFAY